MKARRRQVIVASVAVLLASAAVAVANSFTVSSGHLDTASTAVSLTTTSTTTAPVGTPNFAVTAPAAATAGTPFAVTLQARLGTVADATFAGATCVTFSGPGTSPAPSSTAPAYPAAGACPAGQSSVTFTAGAATVNVTLFRAQTTLLTATSGTRTGTSSAIAVASRGVTLAWSPACPATHPKNTVQTYTLNVPLDAYSNPFTSSTGLAVALTLTGTDAANYKFANTTQATTITITSGPAGNSFAVEASGSKKDATLTATLPAGSGFTAPAACNLVGTT